MPLAKMLAFSAACQLYALVVTETTINFLKIALEFNSGVPLVAGSQSTFVAVVSSPLCSLSPFKNRSYSSKKFGWQLFVDFCLSSPTTIFRSK